MREQRANEARVGADEKVFIGRPIVYNNLSQLIGGAFRERLMPGVFDASMSEDIIASIEHDSSKLLGRTASGTLELKPGPEGIDIEVSDPGTSYSADLRASIGRKDIRGMSFIFEVIEDRWYDSSGITMRDVIKAKLYEVSFVSSPAYLDTQAAARSIMAMGRGIAKPTTDLSLYRRAMRLAAAEE